MKHLILLFLLSFIGCTPHLIETESPSTHSLVNDDMESITVSDPVILLVSNSLCAPAPLIAAPDSDCDGVVDSLDVCPGINDKIDNNNDGKPDCKFPPTYNKVIPAWKCGTPSLQKVFVCFKTNSGGTITICTPYAAVNTHIAAGNRLGICGSSKCGGL